MTDRLTLTRAFERGGIARDAAEAIATEVFDAIHENVATKQDLARTEAALRADLERTEAALRADLARVDAALRADLQQLEQRMQLRLAELEHRLTLRFASVMVVLTGIVLAAIRYLPHS
jgi:hypothetical protein